MTVAHSHRLSQRRQRWALLSIRLVGWAVTRALRFRPGEIPEEGETEVDKMARLLERHGD